jgi:hypothetical protein
MENSYRLNQIMSCIIQSTPRSNYWRRGVAEVERNLQPLHPILLSSNNKKLITETQKSKINPFCRSEVVHADGRNQIIAYAIQSLT